MNKNLRHKDIFDVRGFRVLIIGAGGIGSNTAVVLAKMGIENIDIYDFDKVEEHNIGSQFFGPKDIGKTKVEAAIENVNMLTGVMMTGYPEKFTKESADKSPFYDIVIFAVDSMTARKELFEAIKGKYNLLIDGRMGGQDFLIYSYFSDERDKYAKWLYSDADAVQESCTARAISYNTFGIGAYIGAIIRKYKSRHDTPDGFYYDIPPKVLAGDFQNLAIMK